MAPSDLRIDAAAENAFDTIVTRRLGEVGHAMSNGLSGFHQGIGFLLARGHGKKGNKAVVLLASFRGIFALHHQNTKNH